MIPYLLKSSYYFRQEKKEEEDKGEELYDPAQPGVSYLLIWLHETNWGNLIVGVLV